MRDDDSQDSAHDDTENADPALDQAMRKVARAGESLLLVPRMIIDGKYRIDAELGRGGMGAVYRATHIISQKPVALKCMLRSARDDLARARFLREARAAARIDHPNVVNVYDVGEEEDFCFLVMELLHGSTLGARFTTPEPIEISEALNLLIPAMRGVAAIHRAGVIHRDLKPENIFLCEGPDGTQREAKVLDFGISALRVDDAVDITLTSDGTLLGTPLYMSPEQLQNARDVDERSDIYALGVILYQALTGDPPYEGTSVSSLIMEVARAGPKSMRERRPEIPAGLERVVLRALAKKPEDRYATIDSLIEALVPYAETPLVLLVSQSRSRARAIYAAVACVVLVTLAIAFSQAWHHVREAPVSVSNSAVVSEPHAATTTEPPTEVPANATEPLALAPTQAPQEPQAPQAPQVPMDKALPVRAGQSQLPPVAKKPKAPRHLTATPTKSQPQPVPPDCSLKFSVDASGRRIYKRECVK